VFLTDKKFWLSPVKDTVDCNEPNRTFILGLSGKNHHCEFWVKLGLFPSTEFKWQES